MRKKPVLIWDFDGTLAYQEGKWSQAMINAIRECMPESTLTLSDVRPLMQSGFPWDTPERLHPELCDPQAWWVFLEAYLKRVGRTLGLSEAQAKRVARKVHQVQADPRSYTLYEDTLPTLRQLNAQGWRCLILSNHVPELPVIVRELGLDGYFEAVLGSAATAVEKPHPRAFTLALERAGHPEQAVMIGDNPVADGIGARQAGLIPVLVHAPTHEEFLQCDQLNQLPSLLSELERLSEAELIRKRQMRVSF